MRDVGFSRRTHAGPRYPDRTLLIEGNKSAGRRFDCPDCGTPTLTAAGRLWVDPVRGRVKTCRYCVKVPA